MTGGLSRRAAALATGGAAWSVAARAGALARAGRDIIDLTIGDPEGPPPPEVVAATKAALDAGRTHYTPFLGEPALREAIAAHHAGGRAVRAANVAVVPGAQHGIAALFQVLCDPGDAVVVPAPFYPPYPAAIAAAGARMVEVPAAPGMAFDVDGIVAAMGPGTRAVILNSPANPSGHALMAEDFKAVTAAAARVGAWVIADEVYARLRFSGDHVSAWNHADPQRVAVLGSLSKSHRMSGYRLGWVLGPEPLIAALSGWSAAAAFSVCQFVQDAGLAALALPDAALAPYWRGFAERAATVAAWAVRTPGVSLSPPAGGMFALLDVRGLMADDLAFANALLDATGVAVLPGQAFGASAAGHVRMSLTADARRLGDALDRLAAFAAGLEPGVRAA